MVSVIINFVKLLRKAGITISPAEACDCMEAIKITGFDRDIFKETLKTTLVKEVKDIEVFDKLFRLYFMDSHGGAGADSGFRNFTQKTASTRDGRGQGKSGAGGPGPDLWQAVMSDDEESLAETAQKAVDNAGQLTLDEIEHIQQKIHRLQVDLDWFMVVHKMNKMLDNGDIDWHTYRRWRENLDMLQRLIEEKLNTRLISRYGQIALEKIAQMENIAGKDFNTLNPHQLEQVKKEVHKLGRCLACRKSRRYKKSLAGKVDMRKVTQKGMAYGGIPVKLFFKRRRIERPELILVCDISNSVSPFSAFMLQLVFVAQNYFKSVHSFVFIEHISYVTPLFRQLELEEALVKMKYLAGISETGYSHFGQAFFELYNDYNSLITGKSTVIILGDARNNWRPSGVDYLKQVATACRKLYWLNPQPRREWDKGDSIMSTYSPYCSGVYECRNLHQLKEAVRMIF